MLLRDHVDNVPPFSLIRVGALRIFGVAIAFAERVHAFGQVLTGCLDNRALERGIGHLGDTGIVSRLTRSVPAAVMLTVTATSP